MNQIKNGIANTVKQGVSWPPNLPKFIELCNHSDMADEAYRRFLNGQEPQSLAEQKTRWSIGFQCRTQLSAEKAERLFVKTYQNYCRLERDSKNYEKQAIPQMATCRPVDTMRDSVKQTSLHPLAQRLIKAKHGVNQ